VWVLTALQADGNARQLLSGWVEVINEREGERTGVCGDGCFDSWGTRRVAYGIPILLCTVIFKVAFSTF